MIRRLPYTPLVQPGESPLSVLRRGAIGNGHHSTVRFAFSVNATLDHSLSALGTLARNCDVFHATCRGMGLSEDELGSISYRRTGRGARDNILWQGLAARPGDLQFRRTKLCVACYLEHGYALAEWDHAATLACPKHRILLDDACPCCGTPWTPGSDPLACGCSPDEMAARQQPCTGRTASTMKRIIDAGDQEELNTISRLLSVTRFWSAQGILLTKADVADALAELSHGKWPALPTQEGGVVLHPRVALAPLLAAPEASCLNSARTLLSQAMPCVRINRLAEVGWSASVAQRVLGIGRMPFRKLIEARHIESADGGRFSAASINELLWLVAGANDPAHPMLPLQVLRGGRQRKSLAELISMIKSGALVAFHSGAQAGLPGLSCAVDEPPAPAIPEGMRISDAASRLGTNEESLRRVIKLRLIPATKGTRTSAVQWTIQEPALERFESNYVFASAIARQNGASVTTVASRLRSAGLVPISGPGLDGGATFIFRRGDLEGMDLVTVLSGTYRSPAGRKKHADAPSSPAPDRQTGRDAARALGISLRKLREVVRQGWLSPALEVSRRQSFDHKAVDDLKQRLDCDFIPLGEAACQLGQTVTQFRKTWIATGVVPCRNFADLRLIERADVDRIRAIWSEAGSASSISKDLGRQRWLCQNLTKMGQLSEVAHLGSGSQTVRLFPRNAPLLQHYAPTDPVRTSINK